MEKIGSFNIRSERDKSIAIIHRQVQHSTRTEWQSHSFPTASTENQLFHRSFKYEQAPYPKILPFGVI